MMGRADARLAYLQAKLKDFESATAAELAYAADHFDIIPEIENAVVRIIDKANPVSSNMQIHVSTSPVSIIADKAFFQFIIETLLSQLFHTIQQGIPVSIHITKTGEIGIVEIQESYPYAITADARLHTDPSLIVCNQLMEDMGGELLHLPNEKGNYFRLKFLLC